MTDTALSQSVKDVLAAGLSTGHADSYSDLVTELLWQVVEFRDRITELEERYRNLFGDSLSAAVESQKRIAGLEKERDAAVDALKHIMDIQETAKLAHMRHRTAELEKENAMLREADEEDSACGQAAIDRIATLEKAVKDALKAYPLAMAMRDALTREALPNESEALSSGCALSRGGFKCDS